MGHLLGRHLAASVDTLPDLVFPVPLHRCRLREHGYNQAMEMTKVIKRYVPITSDTRSCTRTLRTLAQSSLESTAKRRQNVRQAFIIGNIASNIRHVALVDDVLTTGATAGELARCLTQVGVTRVDVWVFARAPQKHL